MLLADPTYQRCLMTLVQGPSCITRCGRLVAKVAELLALFIQEGISGQHQCLKAHQCGRAHHLIVIHSEQKVVRLVTVPDFLREPRAGYDATQQKQGEGYHALMRRYQACDVLVFDNLGAGKLTDWVEEQFYLLIGDRYRQRLPVFASTNRRKEAQEPRLDRRVMIGCGRRAR